MEGFSEIFTSIVLEALPFMLLGVILSSIIQMYVSDNLLKKILPKNRFIGGVIASLIGMFLPICECTSVTITRGLIKKNVPINMAITYMLAAPIVNPIAIISTYYAFGGSVKMAAIRTLIGMTAAIIIGFLAEVFCSNNMNNVIKEDKYLYNTCTCGSCNTNNQKGIKQLIINSSSELYNIFGYFVVGAMLASASSLIITKDRLTNMNVSTAVYVILMMAFAYLVSLCSEADAFVASSFIGIIPNSAILSFIILGPMIDIKNTIMLLGYFKKSFVLKLVFLIFSVDFIICCFVI